MTEKMPNILKGFSKKSQKENWDGSGLNQKEIEKAEGELETLTAGSDASEAEVGKIIKETEEADKVTGQMEEDDATTYTPENQL